MERTRHVQQQDYELFTISVTRCPKMLSIYDGISFGAWVLALAFKWYCCSPDPDRFPSGRDRMEE